MGSAVVSGGAGTYSVLILLRMASTFYTSCVWRVKGKYSGRPLFEPEGGRSKGVRAAPCWTNPLNLGQAVTIASPLSAILDVLPHVLGVSPAFGRGFQGVSRYFVHACLGSGLPPSLR